MDEENINNNNRFLEFVTILFIVSVMVLLYFKMLFF